MYQVDEVMDVMKTNIDRVLERDERLNDLDRRADDLNQSSVQFATSAKKVRKKMWFENLKMKLVIGGVLAAILIIIITVIVVETSKGKDSNGGGVTTAVPKN